ncbi:MAG TPA: beta-N-acetylhexosaminidase [Anaerolineaceae bacterium]|nr:beta-N-acetylhexosaminidase [Anaerolineaceae bacterium]
MSPAIETGSAGRLANLIPKPVRVESGTGEFQLSETTKIVLDQASSELAAAGQFLASLLRPPTGLPLEISAGPAAPGDIQLAFLAVDPGLGEEGYELAATPQSILLQANRPAGLFYALQTLRLLLPAEIEAPEPRPCPWTVPACRIRDTPRFAWRGVMLDVARHFHPVADVRRFMGLAAAFKMNRFHLHLSDDQGWRLEIRSWPDLARKGGSTAVSGDPGGYYTQAQYAGLEEYARQRGMILIPEIDLPGHTNAALASYPELNQDGVAPELYTGTEVGFSSLAIHKGITYRFLEDVIAEIAALTSGPYIHIGGDEAQATSHEDYCTFIERAQKIVRAQGKQAIGWEEIGQARLLPGTITQIWNGEKFEHAIRQGGKVIFSLARKTYIDMKYGPETGLGLVWAGTISVRDGYNWDPDALLPGVVEKDILGVETALWSETLCNMRDIEYMAFPRLIGMAEIGWSRRESRSWEEFRARLAALAPRLREMGVNFYAAPEVDWQ